MADFRNRKIPVTERQFLWVQDDDKGEISLHVGPTMVSPTAAERVVIDDGNGEFKEDPNNRPQKMIELADSQYAVLFNPLLEPDQGPNGRFKSGRNEQRPLRTGTRIMIPGPCSFWLRPGQRVEIRDAHELASDQYLLVKVYGEVDQSAPFYDITARSAAIRYATAESPGHQRSTSLSELSPVALTRGQLIVIRGLDTQFFIPPTGVDIVPDTSIDDSGSALHANVARQLLSQIPTITEKKPEPPPPPPPMQEAYDERTIAPPMKPPKMPALSAPAPVTTAAPRSPAPVARPEPSKPPLNRPAEAPVGKGVSKSSAGFVSKMESPKKKADVDRYSLEKERKLSREEQSWDDDEIEEDLDEVTPQEWAPKDVVQSVREQRRASPPPIDSLRDEIGLISDSTEDLSDVATIDAVRKALEREARQARLVRRAVVLGEKEYCVIIDADGKREIKVGPARVFPGPYDTFMTKGSRKRVYDAYELLPQRALWLRVISQIPKHDLEKKLPRGFALDKEAYYPGDELLLTGVSTFFFPFNEIEILSPLSGQVLVGNDHSRAFIEAIGIDQRSGIYVRDLATGEVRLIRGKRSYLVDPRKEVQVSRTVQTDDWNLWIASRESHKRRDTPKRLAWALSINVPHNMAALVTSARGQRVIEGPKMDLLEYEERLTPITLSMGTPKDENRLLTTCYLRIKNNRVSDVISMETSDYVKISVRISCWVTFKAGMQDRWFNHENYVQVLVEHLRSLVRSRIRTMSLGAVWPTLPELVRNIILGEKNAEGVRPSRLLAENGVEITEVDVLSASIDDRGVAEFVQQVQTESVVLQLGDRKAKETLSSSLMREALSQEQHQLSVSAKEREAKLGELVKRLTFDIAMLDAKNQESIAREKQSMAQEREREAQLAKAQRTKEAKDLELSLLAKEAAARAAAERALSGAEIEAKEKMQALAVELLKTRSMAVVAEREAVQKGLIEAMTALGDKVMLSEVAKNMNLVSLFQGKPAGQILTEVLHGLPKEP